MKKVLLIIGLLLTITLISGYDYPTKFTGRKYPAYDCKTLEIMYDSKNRPHKIVIYSQFKEGMTAIDLDANTYMVYSINNGYIYDNTLYCYIYGIVY